MLFFSRWIQKRREKRQLIKEAEAREAETEAREAKTEARKAQIEAREAEIEAREAERRIHREKRDDRQAQALLLTLCELQRTMDPLIAAQVYNNRFCPLISRLPGELILCILDFLCDDVIALKCLRIVSRIFFQLINSRPVDCEEACYIRGEAFYHHDIPRPQFRQLLQRDSRCDHCRHWNDACEYRLLDDCKFQQRFRRSPKGAINYSLYSRLHCYACDSLHDVCQFSSTYQQILKHQPERRCLGQQGSVQLCEHFQITWARIKAHIDDWRQQQRGGGDWQACLDSFNIECHDASHDTRCTASEAPTWPRARLSTSTFDSDIVVLNLEWTPHSRIDALALTADGRIPALELRALFQRLRSLGPADTLCPAFDSGTLPEMAFFSPSSRVGHFVYYKTGEDEMIGPPPASFPPLPSRSWLFWHNRHGKGKNGKKLDIRPHYPRDAGGTAISSQCLVVSYEKDIMICRTTAMTDPAVKIIPTDHWLHAMDIQTYPHPQASHIRPQCRDVACINYYRRRKDFYFCPAWRGSELDNGQSI